MAVKYRTTIDRDDVLEAIRLHAEGKGAKKVSKELGVSLALLKRALMRYDLESEWDEATDKAFPGMRESAAKMTAERTEGVKVRILPDPEPDPKTDPKTDPEPDPKTTDPEPDPGEDSRDAQIERGDENMPRAKATVDKTVPGPKSAAQAARVKGPDPVKGVDRKAPVGVKKVDEQKVAPVDPTPTPQPFDLGAMLGSPTAKIIIGACLLLAAAYMYKKWKEGQEKELEPGYEQQRLASQPTKSTRESLQDQLIDRWGPAMRGEY